MDTTRQALLTAAESLFATQGFDGTPIRAIAEHANANLALIKYYFGSKEGLLETLIDERGAELEAALHEARESGGNSAIAHAAWLVENRSFAALLFIEAAFTLRPTIAAKAIRLRDLGADAVTLGQVMAPVLADAPWPAFMSKPPSTATHRDLEIFAEASHVEPIPAQSVDFGIGVID